MEHIKKINEMVLKNKWGDLGMKIFVLQQRGVKLKKEYDNFEEFYNDISSVDCYYENYFFIEKDNSVVLEFNNGGVATFKIELDTYEVFELEKEKYE